MVIHRSQYFLFVVASIGLVSCSLQPVPVSTPFTPIPPTQIPITSQSPTATQVADSSSQNGSIESTPSPTPIVYKTPIPSLTLPATPIALPLYQPPPGLSYRLNDSLWRVNESGTPELLLHVPEKDNAWPIDENFVIHAIKDDRSISVGFHLIDLRTGHDIELTAPGTNHFCAVWSLDKPTLTLLGILQPEEADPGYDCKGIPALITLNGEVYPLRPEGWAWGYPSQSPDGRTLAFNADGNPWLYEWGVGVKPFQMGNYHFPELADITVFDQSWSPSGTKLAWTVLGILDGVEQQGIGIFDLEQKTSRFLYPFTIIPFEVTPTYIHWSADEKYISTVNFEQETYAILSVDGEFVKRYENLQIQWSPVDPWFVNEFHDYDENKVKIRIEIPKGELIYELPVAFEPRTWINYRWSKDGRYLYIQYQYPLNDRNKSEQIFVLDKTDWQLYRLNLPEGAQLVSWP